MTELELQTPPANGFVRVFNPEVGADSITDMPQEAFEGFWSEKGWELYEGKTESSSEAAVPSAQPVAETAPKSAKNKE